jgi:tRNA pseudouridine55 synthase
MIYRLYKEVGETPLEALERLRMREQLAADVPMTYAGRLDPMAEGELLILAGEECKNKEKYLGLDKEYEVTIVFGIETDTYDGLGIAEREKRRGEKREEDAQDLPEVVAQEVANKVGTFRQEYPAYSSRTVDGVQLHNLARAGVLPDEMPTKEVTIYSIEILHSKKITAEDLQKELFQKIDKVKGDFRQQEIKQKWEEILKNGNEFEVIRLQVKCSSGTYMRSLAHGLGRSLGVGAFALSIVRTKIYLQ